MRTLLTLSGSFASGKSTLADALIVQYGFRSIKTSNYLRAHANGPGPAATRQQLQEFGDFLDRETDYKWIIDAILGEIQMSTDQDQWLLDSVRKRRQLEHLRDAFGLSLKHVSLFAPDDVIYARYITRAMALGNQDCESEYAAAVTHPNEVEARKITSIADLALDTSLLEPAALVQSVITLVQG